MLNSSGESGHPCLVPDFKGNAFPFHHCHSSLLAWGILWTEGLAGYSPWGQKASDMTECLTLVLLKFY